MKKKILKFNFGDWVLVKAYVVIKYLEQEKDINNLNNGVLSIRTLTKIHHEFNARITGATYKQLGEVCKGSYNSEDGPDPNYLSINETKLVYCVRAGLMNKEYQCLEEDLERMSLFPMEFPIKV